MTAWLRAPTTRRCRVPRPALGLPRGSPLWQIGPVRHSFNVVSGRLVGLSQLHAATEQDFFADGGSVGLLEERVDPRIATDAAQHGLFRNYQGQAGGNDGHVGGPDGLVRTTHGVVVVA